MPINSYFGETVTNIPGRVNICARGTGAAASSLTAVKGVTSVAWVSTGKYTINLPRKFAGLVGIKGSIINSAGTTYSIMFASAEAVAASGTITIEIFGGLTTVAPARRDLTSADILLLDINLEDTAVKPAGF
jgi:dTDP-4-amino-4,6-dideoxygalactose transaminase